MEKLLKKYFGYDKFRPHQLEIINSVLNNKDTLVLMPTGGGKSICFQIPALKLEGLTIVISPLISLMKDQVDALKLNGINAEYINSSLNEIQISQIEERIAKKEIKILYIAPERFAINDFKIFLLKQNISLIAIDEAHCISQWGHDFRREYRNLKFLKNTFSNVPIIALTATATLEVRDDILKQLNLDNPNIFISSFNRENLNLIIREKKNSFIKILNLVEKNKNESIIIYCHSRKETEEIAKGLNKYNLKAVVYHAGLSTKLREKNQELFINNKVNIIVATIAFGMGIDKSNVRLVIHNTFSKSIEGYYQEIGRAGRDGLPSDCILFYTRADIRKHEFFINMISDSTVRKSTTLKLNDMINYCESRECRKEYLLNYFGEKFLEQNCKSCDVCLKLPEIKEIEINKTLNSKKIKYDITLFEELKNLRKQIAKERNISPSIIFSDICLKKMATLFPRTENDFIKINGVIESKLKDFGEEFLITINQYIEVKEVYNRLNRNIITEKTVDKKLKKGKKIVKKKKLTKNKAKKTSSSNSELFEKLRTLRMQIATKKNVPPYLVFSDVSLIEMVKKCPKSNREFLNIKGVGEKKLKDYGKDFLNVIISYNK